MKTIRIREIVLFSTMSFIAAMLSVSCKSEPPQISLSQVKAELSPAVFGEAMVTMSITNQGGPDILTAVKTDIPGAKASLHVTQGRRMVTADAMKIPARDVTDLKMGGSHIMIEDMPRAMKEGAKFKMTLVFQKSGEKQIPVMLQATSTATPMGDGHHM
jgi:copper(I)-binding protein